MEAYELAGEELRLKVSELCRLGEAELTKKGGMERVLNLMVRFPELSVENLLLLSVQRPDAIQLGTEDDFMEINNPVRENASPIYLYERGEIEKWYEISDTCDAPSEQIRKEPYFYQGILPTNPLRKRSIFYRFQCSRLYRELRQEGKTMKELASRLVFMAPFAIEARDARRWAYFCEVQESFFWNERQKALYVKKGITGEDLVIELIRTRAYLIAKELGVKSAWEVAGYVGYVMAEMLKVSGYVADKRSSESGTEEKMGNVKIILLQMIDVIDENMQIDQCESKI